MKTKIIIIVLSIVLVVSLGYNYVQMLVLNDQINAERQIIGCIQELEQFTVDQVTTVQAVEHVKKCIVDNTTLPKI